MGSLKIRVVAAFATIYFVWGSTYLAIRYAVESVPPFLMVGARFVLAGALLYGLARLRGAPRPAARHWRFAALLGSLFFLAANGSISWAEAQGLPTGPAALLVATMPLWVLAFDRLLNPSRRFGLGQITGLLLGFVGTALLVGSHETTGVDPFLAAVVLAAGACWALGTVLSPRVPRPADGALSAAMQMLAGGGAAFVVSVVVDEPAPNFHAISASGVVAFIYLALVGTIVAFRCYAYLLDHVAPTRVATYAFVNPVVAALLGLTIGEPFSWRNAAAMVLVVAAVALTLTSRKQPISYGRRPRGSGPTPDRRPQLRSTPVPPLPPLSTRFGSSKP